MTKVDTRPQGTRAVNKALASGAFSRLAIAALNAMTIAVATRHLGPSGYGVLAVAAAAMTMLVVLDMGIGSATLSSLARHLEVNHRAGAETVATSAFVILAAIGGVVGLLGSLIVLILPERLLFSAAGLNTIDIKLSLVIMLVSVGLTLPAGIGAWICAAREIGAVTNYYRTAAALASLVIVSICAVSDAPVWAYAVGTVGAPALGQVLQAIIFTGRSKYAVRLRLGAISWHSLCTVGRGSAPFFVLSAASALCYPSGVVVVAYVRGASESAQLAIGMQMFMMILTIFVGGFQQSWASSARAIAAGDMQWVRTNFWRVMRITVAVGTVVLATLWAFGAKIASIWVGEEIAPPASLMLILSLLMGQGIIQMQCSYLLNAAGRVGEQAVMAIAMTAATIPTSVWLSHSIGLVGPPLALLIAGLTTTSIPTFVLTRRLLRG